MNWTVVTDYIEVLQCPIILEMIHPVLTIPVEMIFCTFDVMHESVVHFLELIFLVVMFDAGLAIEI